MSALLLLALAATSSTTTTTAAAEVAPLRAAPDVTPEVRESLPIEPDDVAWRASGFRLGLGYVLDGVIGTGGVPGGAHHSATLRLGARLDERWSILVALRYGAHLGADAPRLRFSGTLEPTLHLTDTLSLSIGAGVAGLVISSTGAPTPRPVIVASLTLPTTTPLLGACSGTGFIGLARLEQVWVLSALFATGPVLQVDAQWTSCTQATGRSDPDTAEPIELRQYWVTYGVSLGWLLWWR